MSEYITLLGAEEVASAARSMSSAADRMRDAASEFDSAMARHRDFLDDWLARFEKIVDSASRPVKPEVRASRPGDGPDVAHDVSCEYPVRGCTCRAWESGPLG